MALEPPSLSEEIANAQQEINSATSTEAALRRGTVEGAIASSVGLVAFDIKQNSAIRASKLLTSAYALQWAEALGITPLAAHKSEGNVTFTGTNGSTVAANTELVHESSTGTRKYVVTTLTTISGGTATVPVRAVEAGEAGDLEAGVTVKWTSPPVGFAATGVVASGGIVDGTDAETPDDLWERCKTAMRDKSPGGSIGDYEMWAKAVTGVTRAKCYPVYPNPGYATVVIANDSGATPVPSGGLVADVLASINVLKPAQAVAQVLATVKTDVTVAITRLKPITTERQDAVELQIKDLFKRRRGFGGSPDGNNWATDGSDTITPDDIKSAILAELAISEFTLTSPTGSTTAPALGVLHLAAINWTGP